MPGRAINGLKQAIVALLLLASGFHVDAQSAWFADGQLMLPELLVADDTARLYDDVVLALDPDGTLRTGQAAENAVLADVQSVSVTLLWHKPAPVLVMVEGSKSSQCVALEQPRVSMQDHRIVILLVEKALPANVRCQAGGQPFQLMVPLATTDLEPGAYEVLVHRHLVGFDILPEAVAFE